MSDDTDNGSAPAFVMLMIFSALTFWGLALLDTRLVRIECAAGAKPHRIFSFTENDCSKITKD